MRYAKSYRRASRPRVIVVVIVILKKKAPFGALVGVGLVRPDSLERTLFGLRRAFAYRDGGAGLIRR